MEAYIDANVAELILDDGDLLAVLCGENVVEQGGLAASEEAAEHSDGHERDFCGASH